MVYPKYVCEEAFISVLEDGSTGRTVVNPGDVLQYYGRCGGEYPEFKTQLGYYIYVKPEDVEMRMRLLTKTKEDLIDEVTGILNRVLMVESEIVSLREQLESVLRDSK